MRVSRCLVALAFSSLAMTTPTASFGGVAIGLSITVAPPVLPVYVQPPVPGPNYIWAPGYWAWGDYDYYWVPGTWVLAPTPGLDLLAQEHSQGQRETILDRRLLCPSPA